MRERRGPAHARLRAGLRLRPAPWRVAVDRGRVPPGRMPRAWRLDRDDAEQRPEHRLRGTPGRGARDDEGGRDALRSALLGEPAAAGGPDGKKAGASRGKVEPEKAREDDLQIMYGIGGERELSERTLDHLHGYEGARPVRVGNAAYKQRQHDMWGAVLDSVYLHTTSRDHLDERVWPMLCRQVEAALANWREPDRGIWEVRGEPQHFTSSKLMCWVALDRGARLV